MMKKFDDMGRINKKIEQKEITVTTQVNWKDAVNYPPLKI